RRRAIFWLEQRYDGNGRPTTYLTAPSVGPEARVVQAIPDAVRRLAEFPGTFGPDPPPESPIEKIRDGRFTALLTVGASGQMFEALDLGDDVSESLEAARALLRARGRDRAVWFVTPSSRPGGVLDRLRECGLEAADEAPWEPRFASMALLEPPEP